MNSEPLLNVTVYFEDGKMRYYERIVDARFLDGFLSIVREVGGRELVNVDYIRRIEMVEVEESE